MSKLSKTAVILTAVTMFVSAPQYTRAADGIDIGEMHLTGGVTKVEMPGGLAAHAQRLTDVALQNDETAQYVDDLIKKYSKMSHKTKVVAKEFAYAIVPYRGFGPSKDGANILLEKVKKVKTLGAAEYFKQRIADDLHSRIVANLLKMSEGLDNLDKIDGKQSVADAYNNLKGIVGKDKADETVQAMLAWSKDLQVAPSAFQAKQWDIGTLNQNIRKATGASVSNDDVFVTVVKKLNKYNRGKLMCAIGTMVESSCAMGALMAPGFLTPIGVELFNATFVTSTGGNEETKMLNELYFAKRMESRWKRLNEESQMALTAYQMALAHKSPTMLACSENIMRNLVGMDRAKEVLGQVVMPPTEEEKAQLDKMAANAISPDSVDKFVQEKLAKNGGVKSADGKTLELDDVRVKALAEDDGKRHLFRRARERVAMRNAATSAAAAAEAGETMAGVTPAQSKAAVTGSGTTSPLKDPVKTDTSTDKKTESDDDE